MGIFDNLKVTTKSIGKAATNSINTIVAANKENAKINDIEVELSVINEELNCAYKQIGEKFVEYVVNNNEMPGIDVSDILKVMDPKFEKKKELELELVEIEKKLKDQIILQEKEQAENAFKCDKEKLDKARAMDIISEEEYKVKVEKCRRKVVNFEAIRNLKKQKEMGIITYDEYVDRLEDLS